MNSRVPGQSEYPSGSKETLINMGKFIICAYQLIVAGDAMWRQGSRSTLVQVMACCLTAPSHYLSQCWLIISEAQWQSPDGNFTRDASAINYYNQLENYLTKISFKSPRGQRVKYNWYNHIISVSSNLWTHIPFVPCQLALPLLGYGFCTIWPWKSKVQIIAQGHILGSTSYRLPIDSHPFPCSMSTGRPTPGIQLFKNLTLKIQGQCHNSRSTHTPFVPCQLTLPFQRNSFFKI